MKGDIIVSLERIMLQTITNSLNYFTPNWVYDVNDDACRIEHNHLVQGAHAFYR